MQVEGNQELSHAVSFEIIGDEAYINVNFPTVG